MPDENDRQQAAMAVCELVLIPHAAGYSELFSALSAHINLLINSNFSMLVHLLYKMDVSEKTLKELLASQSANAGDIIAELMIQRQLEKIKTRRAFKQPGDQIPEDERW